MINLWAAPAGRRVHLHIYIYTHTYDIIHIYIYIHTYVRTYVRTYTHRYIYIYYNIINCHIIYTNIHTHILYMHINLPLSLSPSSLARYLYMVTYIYIDMWYTYICNMYICIYNDIQRVEYPVSSAMIRVELLLSSTSQRHQRVVQGEPLPTWMWATQLLSGQ